jgi:hypothetical protein
VTRLSEDWKSDRKEVHFVSGAKKAVGNHQRIGGEESG